MLTLDPSLGAPESTLHEPDRRRLLMARPGWEVRGLPGCCPFGHAWLSSGLWHLQFFSAASHLSVLAFVDGAPVAPFMVRAAGLGRSLLLDHAALDAYLAGGLGLRAESAMMSNLTRLMHDKALCSVVRTRAWAALQRTEALAAD
jgi:hypothetical protein